MTDHPPQAEHVERFRRDLEALTGESPAELGVAVSGGPDSVALLLLAAAAYPDSVRAATIDHRLRPESAAEARFVAALCTELDVPHCTLAGERPAGASLQARARALRYRLLGDWMKRTGIRWLATGHHADDQAETMLMRLNRGAGLAGLAAIRSRRRLEGTERAVVRPLLGWRRSELAQIVAAAGIEPVEDPTNSAPDHDRTHVRRLLEDSPLLDPVRLAASASHLCESEEALAWAADRAWLERSRRSGRSIELDASGLPRELRRRLLVRAIDEVRADHGLSGDWRRDGAAALLDALDRGGGGTLAGVLARGAGAWRLTAEPPRRPSG